MDNQPSNYKAAKSFLGITAILIYVYKRSRVDDAFGRKLKAFIAIVKLFMIWSILFSALAAYYESLSGEGINLKICSIVLVAPLFVACICLLFINTTTP